MAKKKILVIDDDQILLRILCKQLNDNGYETAFASDGITAISVARKEKPNLIILDIGLPAGDGFLLLQRLRSFSFLVSTPIIVHTIREKEKNEERVLEDGAYAFLQKPVNNDELLSTIQKALEKSDKSESERKVEPTIVLGKKFLLVGNDEDRDELDGLLSNLENNNHKGIISSGVFPALNLAKKEKPDMIVLCVGDRDSIGFKVMERMELLPFSVPVIILCGKNHLCPREYQSFHFTEQARIVGAVAFLQRPVNHIELFAAINKAFVKTA